MFSSRSFFKFGAYTLKYCIVSRLHGIAVWIMQQCSSLVLPLAQSCPDSSGCFSRSHLWYNPKRNPLSFHSHLLITAHITTPDMQSRWTLTFSTFALPKNGIDVIFCETMLKGELCDDFFGAHIYGLVSRAWLTEQRMFWILFETPILMPLVAIVCRNSNWIRAIVENFTQYLF